MNKFPVFVNEDSPKETIQKILGENPPGIYQGKPSLDTRQIIIENGTQSECNTRNAPTDALIVHYIHNDRDCYDLTRGSRTKLFDMYYDKFKNNLKDINYGGGNIKPSMWGYKTTSKSKKRK